NPSSDTWRNVADLATPVDSGVGLWADDRFIVLGGRSSASSVLTAERAQIYDPSSNTWAVAAGTGAALTERMALSCAVTDGDAVYFWGGRTAASTWVASDIGAVLDPSVDSTTALASAGQPDNDSLVYCALTGTEFLVVTDDQLGRYDLFTETWTTQSLPSSVEGGPCTWTGRELIVHEVTGPDIHVWNPTTDQWTTTSITDSSNVVPVEVTPHVWTGDVAIFLGLGSSDQYATFGPRTVTATGIGSDLNSGGRIVGMSHHWTGDRLLVFGGLSQASPLTVASGGAIFQ
ncbi:MAG: hypothetical protein GY884_21435, partial [Proteobacteria bacterium]|nr:hypothetical protein [Pseudomonadota bacterium]